MFDFAKKIVNSGKKKYFNKNMRKVYDNIKSAWKFIKYAEEEAAQGNKDRSSNCVRIVRECLLEAHKYLIEATNYMPKYDLEVSGAVVAVIMKLGDPMMYDYIYPRFRPVYEFKNKEIEKEWEAQVNTFVEYSKKLIEYEKLLNEYPYSSLLKDYKK
jgi:hypothetical protein